MSERAKREQARRVWRLNKKEGVPVLEALEAVDIGKDVYYRIKREREEEWEEEILTAESIQKRLSEVSEKLEKREKRLEQMEQRLVDAQHTLDQMEMVDVKEQRVYRAEQQAEEVAEKVDRLMAEADLDEADGPTATELKAEIEQLRESIPFGEVESLREDVETVKERAQRNSRRISEMAESDDSGGWF